MYDLVPGPHLCINFHVVSTKEGNSTQAGTAITGENSYGTSTWYLVQVVVWCVPILQELWPLLLISRA